jgi:hypothetical protein
VANGIAPDTRRRSSWLGFAVVIAAIAVAAVVVPPLIAPHHHASPRASSPAPVTSSVSSAAPSATVAQPLAATSAPARFAPITVEAEDPRNTLSGGAAATGCGTCRGGGRVRYVCLDCRVTVRATVPVAGKRTVTVFYEVDGDRSLKVSINDAKAGRWPVNGPGWDTPRSFRFTADLPAGPVRLTLFNDESPAPDVDEVVIS